MNDPFLAARVARLHHFDTQPADDPWMAPRGVETGVMAATGDVVTLVSLGPQREGDLIHIETPKGSGPIAERIPSVPGARPAVDVDAVLRVGKGGVLEQE